MVPTHDLAVPHRSPYFCHGFSTVQPVDRLVNSFSRPGFSPQARESFEQRKAHFPFSGAIQNGAWNRPLWPCAGCLISHLVTRGQPVHGVKNRCCPMTSPSLGASKAGGWASLCWPQTCSSHTGRRQTPSRRSCLVDCLTSTSTFPFSPRTALKSLRATLLIH